MNTGLLHVLATVNATSAYEPLLPRPSPKPTEMVALDHQWETEYGSGILTRAQRGEPIFEVAGFLTEVVNLGNLAIRAGGEIAWDATAYQVTNNPAANEFIEPHVRPGWEYSL